MLVLRIRHTFYQASHRPSTNSHSASCIGGALQMKETPLIRCAHNGHLQAVKTLMARGASVNALDLVRYHTSD